MASYLVLQFNRLDLRLCGLFPQGIQFQYLERSVHAAHDEQQLHCLAGQHLLCGNLKLHLFHNSRHPYGVYDVAFPL